MKLNITTRQYFYGKEFLSDSDSMWSLDADPMRNQNPEKPRQPPRQKSFFNFHPRLESDATSAKSPDPRHCFFLLFLPACFSCIKSCGTGCTVNGKKKYILSLDPLSLPEWLRKAVDENAAHSWSRRLHKQGQ
jgi:hypothetical protein